MTTPIWLPHCTSLASEDLPYIICFKFSLHKLLSSCWSLVHVRALEITIWIPPCPNTHFPPVTAPGEGQEPAPEGTPLLHPLFILDAREFACDH